MIKLTTFDRDTRIISLMGKPWRSASDAVGCQLDLNAYGQAYAVMHGGRMEHVPVELVRSWRESERDLYAESG